MVGEKTSILLSDVSIEGQVVEKDKIIIDAKIVGDVKAEDIITHSKSNIIGNLESKFASLGGKLKQQMLMVCLTKKLYQSKKVRN